MTQPTHRRDMRTTMRDLLLAAREAGQDPLQVIGTYFAHVHLSGGSVQALMALTGKKKRTAQRYRANLAAVIEAGGVPYLAPLQEPTVPDMARTAPNMAPLSLLSTKTETTEKNQNCGAPSGGAVLNEGPSSGATEIAVRRLYALGLDGPQVAQCLTYAREKWPTIKRVKEGTIEDEPAYLRRVLVDYAEERDWIHAPTVETVVGVMRARDVTPSLFDNGHGAHRQGEPCRSCGEATATTDGACGKFGCPEYLQPQPLAPRSAMA